MWFAAALQERGIGNNMPEDETPPLRENGRRRRRSKARSSTLRARAVSTNCEDALNVKCGFTMTVLAVLTNCLKYPFNRPAIRRESVSLKAREQRCRTSAPAPSWRDCA